MKNIFESRKLPYVAFLTLTVAVVASLTYATENQIPQNVIAQNESADSAQLQAANVTGELTKPAGGNPYGGEKIGDITISSDGHQTDIKGLVSASPAEGNVYEAWLGDAGGSEYKLSLGQLNENGTINVSQHLVNPFTYTIFFITEEPQDDVDPNSADAIAGVQLKAPFGQ
ncbi:MAG: anti-sigma factor [Nitrososphaeraceae archaeon]